MKTGNRLSVFMPALKHVISTSFLIFRRWLIIHFLCILTGSYCAWGLSTYCYLLALEQESQVGGRELSLNLWTRGSFSPRCARSQLAAFGTMPHAVISVPFGAPFPAVLPGSAPGAGLSANAESAVREMAHRCPVAKDDGFEILSSILAAWKFSVWVQGFINSSLNDSLCMDPSVFCSCHWTLWSWLE